MTNQFTDEQVKIAGDAFDAHLPLYSGATGTRPWCAGCELGYASQAEAREHALRAALEAAAGVAPQAGSENVEAVGALNAALTSYSTGALLEVEYRNAALLARRALLAPTRVQPSSTVDEGKLAEVIAAHEMTSWGSRKWSGCECGEVYEVCPEGIVKWHANHRARAVVEAIGGESHAHD